MNEKDLIYWIWLSEIKGIGPVLARSLLKKFKSPYNVYNAEIEELLSINGIGPKAAKNILSNRSLKKAEIILNNCLNNNIKITTKDCANYPIEAKNIWEMPILFYYRGNIIENLSGVGIVGTRRCTEYGKKIAVGAAEYLSQNNIPVISGMAKGIDSYAHTASINSDGYTIAVLGCGVDICYPNEHIKLMEKILENGAIISQYPPGTKPNAINFPKRNKIIAGISKKILVAEAGEKSGSLITANYAKKYNKDIYAAPGSIYSNQSRGTNKLLEEGAKVYLNAKVLVEGLDLRKDTNYITIDSTKSDINSLNEVTTHKSLHYDKIEKIIIDTICKNPKTVEELIILLKDYDLDVIEKISLMELEGKIRVDKGRVKIPDTYF